MRKLSLLSLLTVISLCQLQAQQMRLKSLVNTTYIGGSFVPDDSTTYKYRGLMTSYMKTGVYNYDTSVMYVFNSINYAKYKLYRKIYNAKDSVTSLYEKDWVDSSSTWVDVAETNSNFLLDSELKDRSYLYPSGGHTEYTLYYEYDAITHDNIGIHKVKYPGPTPPAPQDSISRTLYTYNASHAVVNVTTQVYSHGGGFPPTPPGYVNLFKTEYYYNSSGLDTAELVFNWDATVPAWVKNTNTVYTYDGSNRRITARHSFFAPASGFYITDKDSMSYNSDNNVIATTNLTYDTATHVYMNHRQVTWTYDVSPNPDNPLVMNTYSWTGTAWAPLNGQDNQRRYHYELVVGVHTLNKAIGSLDIFPVPATTTLNIKMNWNHAEPFTVSIYDMQGRIMVQCIEAATANYQRAIPMTTLPAGNYTVRIQSAGADMSRQFNLVK